MVGADESGKVNGGLVIKRAGKCYIVYLSRKEAVDWVTK